MQINISKKFIALVVVVLIIFGIYDIWLRSARLFDDLRGLDISHVIELLLGNSNVDDPAAMKAADILGLSDEEWNKPSCPHNSKFEWNDLSCNKGRIIRVDSLSPLKECTRFVGGGGCKAPYCNHWTRHNCIALGMREYVFQRPDILNKIVEILERPCKYFPTEKEFKEKGVKKIPDVLERARRILNCSQNDNKPKKPYYFTIAILDRDLQKQFEIVIRRKK